MVPSVAMWFPHQLESTDISDDVSAAPVQEKRFRKLQMVALIIIAIVVWLPLGNAIWVSRPYELDLAVHFTKHIAAVLIVAGIVVMPLRWWRFVLIVGTAGITLAGYAIAHDHPPTGAIAGTGGWQDIRLVHYNAYGNRSRHDEAFLDWLRETDPDLVCIVDVPWNFTHSHPWLAERYPYRAEPKPGVAWPNLLLSKYPAQIVELVDEVDEVTKWSFVARRSMLVSPPGGESFLFTAFHPPSPRSVQTWKLSLRFVHRDAGVLSQWMESHDNPVLVSSDCNSTPLGRIHRAIAQESGLLGWSRLLGGGTWPSNVPTWLSLPIDRLWTSSGVRVRSLTVGPHFISDHRPVVAGVVLPAPER